jgi:hypothetical protein
VIERNRGLRIKFCEASSDVVGAFLLEHGSVISLWIVGRVGGLASAFEVNGDALGVRKNVFFDRDRDV